MKANELQPELLQGLNSQESEIAANERLEKVQMKAYMANKTITINDETVSSEPVIKIKSKRRKKN